MEPMPQPPTPARTTDHYPGLVVAALASIGAGAIHGAATGIHAEHPDLARIFVVVTVLQLGVGIWALVRPTRAAAAAVVVVNAGAVLGWLATRLWGVSWIDGLQEREAAQFADTVCAALGAAAAGLALAGLLVGKRQAAPVRLAVPALLVAALAIPAMWTGGTHQHSHDDAAHDHSLAVGADGQPPEDTAHAHDTSDTTAPGGTTDTTHGHTHDTTNGTVAEELAAWPRPYDPAQPMNLSGVPGVTAEQQARAAKLIADAQRDLPKWSDVKVAVADGYTSIGDARTGSEHFIKIGLIQDDVMLDPTQPESLVYTVKGDQRILAGAMFIASARATDDPTLTGWAGPLMTWHNHGNLCWDRVDGVAKVVGLTDANGKCARGVNLGAQFPMVHVWITPNQCGPFAALEGEGAGQAAVSEAARTDMCHEHDHGTTGSGTGTSTGTDPKPYDPTQPIDLSGTPGVTPEQQAAAENLIAITIIRLPQWSDYKVAEAAGFHSIGDGITGEEHYINWNWINDKDWLDPDHPESLVYRPKPDGSKELVSAMFMLPDTMTLDEVPNIGGALMQWHIHDNLCFTNDPVAPRVGGITSSGGPCTPPLVKFRPSPMIHVWIVPHPCGPFAALEGVGAGQIKPGETRLCDHAHGSTGLLG